MSWYTVRCRILSIVVWLPNIQCYRISELLERTVLMSVHWRTLVIYAWRVEYFSWGRLEPFWQPYPIHNVNNFPGDTVRPRSSDPFYIATTSWTYSIYQEKQGRDAHKTATERQKPTKWQTENRNPSQESNQYSPHQKIWTRIQLGRKNEFGSAAL